MVKSRFRENDPSNTLPVAEGIGALISFFDEMSMPSSTSQPLLEFKRFARRTLYYSGRQETRQVYWLGLEFCIEALRFRAGGSFISFRN